MPSCLASIGCTGLLCGLGVGRVPSPSCPSITSLALEPWLARLQGDIAAACPCVSSGHGKETAWPLGVSQLAPWHSRLPEVKRWGFCWESPSVGETCLQVTAARHLVLLCCCRFHPLLASMGQPPQALSEGVDFPSRHHHLSTPRLHPDHPASHWSQDTPTQSLSACCEV